MGIRGLERYLEQNNRDACYTVNVKELILNYKKSTGKTPKIVIDGMSLMRRLYTNNYPWIFGGMLREYSEILKKFITAFTNLGAELIVFFDGPPELVEREDWIQRRLHTVNGLFSVFDDLSRGVHPLKLHPKIYPLPANVGTVHLDIFSLYGCKVYRSISECDKEISSYALENDCLAILAQDSDFVILGGARYYWSIKHFNLTTMTTCNYDRIKLAYSLNLLPGHLPLVASLMGNNIVSYDLLMPFKKRLLRNNFGRNFIDFKACLSSVSQFVRRYPVGMEINKYLPEIAQEVFLDENKATLLYGSIISYDVKKKTNEIISSGNSHWDAVLKLAMKKHKANIGRSYIFTIIMYQRYWAKASFEDLRDTTLLPAVQNILKKLRQHIYGILLLEKPLEENKNHEVKELVVSSLTSLNKDEIVPAILPAVKHPGLLALWNVDDKSFCDERWDLVADALQVNPSSVRELPPHLIIPSVSLLYLLKNGLSLSTWEINAILATNIVLRQLSIENLKLLPKNVADVRAVRILTIIAEAYAFVITLFQVCGSPLELDYVIATNYQDGKLFHLKYMEAKTGCSLSKLLYYDKKCEETFEMIYDFISRN